MKLPTKIEPAHASLLDGYRVWRWCRDCESARFWRERARWATDPCLGELRQAYVDSARYFAKEARESWSMLEEEFHAERC